MKEVGCQAALLAFFQKQYTCMHMFILGISSV